MESHHILIVDDQWEVRKMLRAGLETLGAEFSVVDVPSGEEAMLVISHQRIDLLVTDVLLPGISGLELKKRAQYYNPGLKMILITGLTDPNLRRQVSDAGVEAFFFKPVELAGFLAAVERCLGSAKSIQYKLPSFEAEAPVQNLAERISSLRQHLDAISAVLLNDRGQVLARAGDLPDAGGETNLIPALMATFSTSSKVSNFLGVKSPENLLCFAGSKYDLFLAHVDQSMALLLVINTAPEGERIGKILRAVRSTVNDLHSILATMVAAVQPENQIPVAQDDGKVVLEEEPGDEGIVPELEVIFKQATESQYRTEDADAFWDSLNEQGETESVINPDAISYDQARQLGLALEEDGPPAV